jgi:phage-related protein
LLSYPATITLSTRALNHLTDLIRRERGLRRCRWRRLDLAHLRNGDTYLRL